MNRQKSWITYVTTFLVLLFAFSGSQAADRTIYFHTDGIGSVVAATDQQGEILWREAYRPYGSRMDKVVATSDNTPFYTGKPHDDTTGLSYFGARYYDPEIGRFMGIDPVGVDPENPHSFNRYAYANNNPYRFVDPDGNVAVLAALIILGITGDIALDTVFAPDVAFNSGAAQRSGALSGFGLASAGKQLAGKAGSKVAEKFATKGATQNGTLLLGRQASVVRRVGEGRGVPSIKKGGDSKAIFKKNYSDIRRKGKIDFDMTGVPETQSQIGKNFEGGFSRAEEFMIRQRDDLVKKTRFFGER